MAFVFADRNGELRGNLIVMVFAAALVLLALGGAVGMTFGAVMGSNALATWIIGAFIVIKIPLLGLMWWVLGRKRERGTVGKWSTSECHEILEYLEREARASMGRPDAQARLAYFCKEAWFVATTATDADTADAVQTAQRIDALASEAGVDTSRSRADAMLSGSVD